MADRNLEIALRIKADLESARKQLDELNKSVRATGDNSKASGDKIAAVGERINEMQSEAAGLNKTLGITNKTAAALGTQVAQLGQNLASGNFGGAARNIAAVGGSMSTTAAGAGILTLGIGSVVAVLGLFAVAAVKGYQEDQELARSIIATGNYAGVTTGQVRVMAETLDTVSGRSDNARKALQLLIASGRVSDDSLQRVARAALDLSTVTGQSIDKSVQAFVRMQDEPVAAVKALDDSLHFLTLTQYQHIKALQDQGDMEAASATAQEAASVAVHQRALEVVASTGLMERGWDNLRSHVIATWNAMKDVGATKTAADDLAAINKELDGYRQRVTEIRARRGDSTPITDADLAGAGEVALSRDRIKQLLAQKQVAAAGAQMESWIAASEASSAKANDVLKRDSDFWDRALAGAKSDAAKQKEINAVNAAAARDTKLAPNNAALFEQNRQDALALIEKKYATKTATPRAGADDSAAIARAAASAVDQQVQSLIRLQGELDPATKAWADYNLEVAKQDKIAATAKAAPSADVAAIDARRNANIALAAGQRDAALATLQHAEVVKKLSDVMQQADALLNDQGRQEQNIQAEQQAGLISEYSARKKILDLHQATAAQLDALLPKYRELVAAAAAGDPRAVEQLKNLEAELGRLKLQTNDLKTAFESGLTSGLEQALEGLATRTMTVGEAFKSLARTVVQSLAQVAARALAAKAIDAIGGLFGGDKKADVGEGATKLALAGGIVGGASALLGTSADKLQAAATTLMIANSIGSIGGFAEGGYTGHGGKYQVAGVVHRGEGVLSQREIAALGGPSGFYALRQAISVGYADGGYVNPLNDAPLMPALRMPRASIADADRSARSPGAQVALRNVNIIDPALVSDYLNSSDGETAVMNIISRNEIKIRHMAR